MLEQKELTNAELRKGVQGTGKRTNEQGKEEHKEGKKEKSKDKGKERTQGKGQEDKTDIAVAQRSHWI